MSKSCTATCHHSLCAPHTATAIACQPLCAPRSTSILTVNVEGRHYKNVTHLQSPLRQPSSHFFESPHSLSTRSHPVPGVVGSSYNFPPRRCRVSSVSLDCLSQLHFDNGNQLAHAQSVSSLRLAIDCGTLNHCIDTYFKQFDTASLGFVINCNNNILTNRCEFFG